jgi:hypothetical protein
MIDKDIRKVRDYFDNTIIAKEYTKDDVNNDLKKKDIDEKDNYLLELKEYVLKLVENADDVQQYLRENPFTSDSQSEVEIANEKAKWDRRRGAHQGASASDRNTDSRQTLVDNLNNLKI